MSTGEIAEKLSLGLNTFEYNLQLKYNSPCPCLQRCPQGISY
ncbi:hypothetical protein MmTuc01_1247 [Methanosarcina mazei Tuc01]|uniref:Uncharacterized protein n=1 Tax=Methanosarcina mazei Tuc01 TaxID=1236903 RepID=M1QI42_METMZ|nr:hypothetical protein MmTuc01_1247 [Methanosarcina mazei Tuc01]